MRVLSRMLVLLFIVLPVVAAAGGVDADVIGARGTGRAGAVLVSDDGGAALLLNPGGLVRRSEWRVQVGLRLDDDDSAFRAADAPASPLIADHAPPTGMPHLAIQIPLGRLVLGAAYVEEIALHRSLPRPAPDQTAADVARLAPHRYAGVALRYRRRTLLAGVSLRARPWLGAGMSLSAARAELAEERHIWAGMDGRDLIGDPARDLVLGLRARDAFVPGVSAGILVAPPELPIELAASASYARDAALDGSARLHAAHQGDYPAPAADGATAHIIVASPLVARAGVRYLGSRVLVEVGAELMLHRREDRVWSVQGATVRDDSQVEVALDRAPSLVYTQTHGAIRAAIDVEVVPGFLWLLAGYAYQTAATPDRRIGPAFGDPDGHTVALGAEGQWSGTTLTIGYARVLRRARHVAVSDIEMINPFDAGSAPVAQGSHDSSRDMVGVLIDIAWD